MAHRKTLTHEQELQLTHLNLKCRFTDGEIAKVLRIDRQTVWYVRQRLGLDAVTKPGRYKPPHKST